MKSREFERKHLRPIGAVLEKQDGDHNVWRLPNGRTFVVPTGGKHTEAKHWLEPKLRKLLREEPRKMQVAS